MQVRVDGSGDPVCTVGTEFLRPLISQADYGFLYQRERERIHSEGPPVYR